MSLGEFIGANGEHRIDKAYELFKYTYLIDSSPGTTPNHYNQYYAQHGMDNERTSLKLKCDFFFATSSTGKLLTRGVDSVDKYQASKIKWFKLDAHNFTPLKQYYFRVNDSSPPTNLNHVYITSNLNDLLKQNSSTKLTSHLVFKFKNANDLVATSGVYMCKFDESQQLISQVSINGSDFFVWLSLELLIFEKNAIFIAKYFLEIQKIGNSSKFFQKSDFT